MLSYFVSSFRDQLWYVDDISNKDFDNYVKTLYFEVHGTVGLTLKNNDVKILIREITEKQVSGKKIMTLSSFLFVKYNHLRNNWRE